MTDISELFNHVAPPAEDPAASVVDADIARGRQALTRDHRRRTIRRSMTATATVAAAAVAAVVIAGIGGNDSHAGHHPAAVTKPKVQVKTHHHTTVVKTKPRSTAPIKLVAYTGDQPQGFTVDSIPAGWFLGGVNQFALTIDPAGDPDVSASDFVGKLVVLTQSVDMHGLGSGTLVSINGQAGRIRPEGKGLGLNYTTPAGFGVEIQSPGQLNWSDAQLIAFADGVHVTDQAVQSSG